RVSASTAGTGASSPFAASALALPASSCLIRASSAAYGSVTASPALFSATVVWLRKAAFSSMALAKAQENAEIPDNGFTRSPRYRLQGGISICIAHAGRVTLSCGLSSPGGNSALDRSRDLLAG